LKNYGIIIWLLVNYKDDLKSKKNCLVISSVNYWKN